MGMNRLNMDTAGVDALGGEMHCLLAGPALTIDGRGRNVPGGNRRREPPYAVSPSVHRPGLRIQQ